MGRECTFSQSRQYPEHGSSNGTALLVTMLEVRAVEIIHRENQMPRRGDDRSLGLMKALGIANPDYRPIDLTFCRRAGSESDPTSSRNTLIINIG
jgi:hypothetical protein